MSIARSLKWLFDRNAYREELEEQQRWMQQFPDQDPDKGPKPPSLEVKEDAQRFRCKFCGRVETQGRYCPDCLADTMVLLKDDEG